MMGFLLSLAYWHWFVLAGLLLIGEMALPSAILLWPGVAAVVIGMLTFVIPLPWLMSVPMWAVLSIVLAFGWRAYRQKNPAPVDPTAQTLNQRGAQYIGRVFTLTEPIINGVGQVRVDDTIWKVISHDDFIAGATIKVVGVEGTSLRVEAL